MKYRATGPHSYMTRPSKSRYHLALRKTAQETIIAALLRFNGNRTHASRYLGLQRTYLCKLIVMLDLKGYYPGTLGNPERTR